MLSGVGHVGAAESLFRARRPSSRIGHGVRAAPDRARGCAMSRILRAKAACNDHRFERSRLAAAGLTPRMHLLDLAQWQTSSFRVALKQEVRVRAHVSLFACLVLSVHFSQGDVSSILCRGVARRHAPRGRSLHLISLRNSFVLGRAR